MGKGADLIKLSHTDFIDRQVGATIIINLSGDVSMQGGVFQMLSNYNTLSSFNTVQKIRLSQCDIKVTVPAPEPLITCKC